MFSGKLTVKASVRFFHVPKYTEFEFKLKTDLSGTFGGYVKGKLEVPLTEDPLVFMPLKNVVEVTAKPVFKVEFEGKLVGENLGENSQKTA